MIILMKNSLIENFQSSKKNTYCFYRTMENKNHRTELKLDREFSIRTLSHFCVNIHHLRHNSFKDSSIICTNTRTEVCPLNHQHLIKDKATSIFQCISTVYLERHAPKSRRFLLARSLDRFMDLWRLRFNFKLYVRFL